MMMMFLRPGWFDGFGVECDCSPVTQEGGEDVNSRECGE